MTPTPAAASSAFDTWREQVPDEVAFWEGWARTRGREWPEDFQRRFDPEAPIDGRLGDVLAALGPDHVRLLDVGAGPVTVLGKTVPGKAVEITAVDPLADAYAELLERAGLAPLVATSACDGERLAERFAPGSFDVAHARNAIDHSYDPLRVVAEMLAVVRPGGHVVLGHESDEAVNESYVGLHQWNFAASAAGAFVIWNPEGLVDVTERLRGIAHVETHHEGGWLDVVVTRLPSSAGMDAAAIARHADVARRFDRHLVELLVEETPDPSPADSYRLDLVHELAGEGVLVTTYAPEDVQEALAVAVGRAAHVGLLAGTDGLERRLDLRADPFSAYAVRPELDRMALCAAAEPDALSGWLMRAAWLEAALAGPAPEPQPVRGRRVVARLDDLREAPELLHAWARAFTDLDDVTLVVVLPADDPRDAGDLERLAALAGLDAPGAPDVLAVVGDPEPHLEGADGRLSTRPDPHPRGLPALGLLGDPSELRSRVLLPGVTGIQADRVEAMRRRWDCARVSGRPQLLQPALLTGPGRIELDDEAVLGWPRSPGFLTGYVYVEAGLPESVVRVGPGCYVNNDVCLRSEGPGITIGRDVLIGYGVHVYDSDFHAVDPRARAQAAPPRTAAVTIGDGAWVGANAMILKGVEIGAGAVVAAGAIVTRSVPAATLVAGNPARIVRALTPGEDQAAAAS